MRLVLAAAVFAAMPALASEPGAPFAGMEDVPVEEWVALAEGRTLTYTIDGAFWAMERYQRGGNRVTLEFYDGSCLEGTWEHVAPLYCFHWEGEGTSCFRHVRLGEEILILETRDGVETGALQVMSGASDTPLACGVDGVS